MQGTSIPAVTAVTATTSVQGVVIGSGLVAAAPARPAYGGYGGLLPPRAAGWGGPSAASGQVTGPSMAMPGPKMSM